MFDVLAAVGFIDCAALSVAGVLSVVVVAVACFLAVIAFVSC